MNMFKRLPDAMNPIIEVIDGSRYQEIHDGRLEFNSFFFDLLYKVIHRGKSV